jgi:alanine dehydrogenase
MPDTLILTRRDVAALLTMRDCIDVVERAFRQHAAGEAVPPGVLGAHVHGGGFHVKTAGLLGDRVFVAKVNANFPGNAARHGLPTIQGVVALFDVESGRPLAILDSIEITILRTAAATAVAARHLARENASVVAICGCGEQGRSQLRALREVRALRRVRAYDLDADCAVRYAQEMSVELGISVTASADVRSATLDADIVVTCTPSRQWLLGRDDVSPGTFIAAVGTDHPEKQEIEPALLAASRVVVDVLDQCATIGDLHHALDAGLMTRGDVHAELSEIVSGRKVGRRTAEEIIVFDSTGTALEDVAAASLVYERAVKEGVGLSVNLGGL